VNKNKNKNNEGKETEEGCLLSSTHLLHRLFLIFIININIENSNKKQQKTTAFIINTSTFDKCRLHHFLFSL